MNFRTPLTIVLVSTLGVGCQRSGAARVHAVAPPSNAAPHAIVRLDFVLTTTEGDEAKATSYTLSLEENTNGELRQGETIPLVVTRAPSALPDAPHVSPRIDVGTTVRAKFKRSSERGLAIQTDFEATSVDPSPPSGMHRLEFKTNAVIPFGTRFVIGSSVWGVTGHTRKSELTVVATRLE